MKRSLVAALLALAGIALAAVPASAQVYGERRQPQVEIPREALQCTGTVKQVSRGVIGLESEAGDKWLVQVEAARPQDLSFTGSADATFVKPGMWIRFTTKLTRRGDAQEPIATAEIYTPREGFGVGVYPEGADAGGGGEGGALFAPAGEEKPKPEPKAKVREEDINYRVGGQVSRISRLGELTINAGGTSVKATLAEDAKISVDVADLSFLRVGDSIEVRGWYPAGTKGRAIANQVTASSAEPLSDPSKKKKPAPAATEKPADGDQPPADKPSSEKPSAEKPAEGEKKPAEAPADEK